MELTYDFSRGNRTSMGTKKQGGEVFKLEVRGEQIILAVHPPTFGGALF